MPTTVVTAMSASSNHSSVIIQKIRNMYSDAIRDAVPQPDSINFGRFDDKICSLTATFELLRVDQHSEQDESKLDVDLITRVLSELATKAKFSNLHSPTRLYRLELLLRLLSIGLRLYKYNGKSLRHELHSEIYDGITELWEQLHADRHRRDKTLRVEDFNVRFLLQHCQYILVSIDSTASLSRQISRVAVQGFDIAMMVVSRAFHEIRHTALEIMKRQRSRPKWHREYLYLEDLCWSVFASDICIPAMKDKDDSIFVDESVEATHFLLESMETHLPESQRKSTRVRNLWRKVKGTADNAVTGAGTFEENGDYFAYGVLDLLYQLTFRIRPEARPKCFPQFVQIIRLVLERSPSDATHLHTKATDLWNRILLLGNDDRTSYANTSNANGTDDAETDADAIKYWISKHRDEAEDKDTSEKYNIRLVNSDFV